MTVDEVDAHRIEVVQKAVVLMSAWTTDAPAAARLIQTVSEQALGPSGDSRELADLVAGLVLLCDGPLLHHGVHSGEGAAEQLRARLEAVRG